MIQDSNKLPPGKVCPDVNAKKVVAIINASIGEDGRTFNVVLENGDKAKVAESALLDTPKEEEKA